MPLLPIKSDREQRRTSAMQPMQSDVWRRAPAAFVACWLVLLLVVSLGCIPLYTVNIGIAEDWQMVAPMTGHEPDLVSWLWSQNNEHRLPVQRLIYLVLLWATHDFRSGMVLSQALLAILAAGMAVTAARLRGRPDWSDAIFPLALLHLGHWENLLWGWQIQFVWSAALSGLLLVMLACRPVRDGPLWVAGVSLVTVFIAVSGANGVILAASMAAGMILTALWLTTDRPSRRALLGGAAAVTGVIGLYFVHFEWPTWTPPPASLSQTVRTTGIYLGMALGPGAALNFPRTAALAVAAVLAIGTAVAVERLWFGDTPQRRRALGMLTMIAASMALGVAIARSRGALASGLPARYALFSAFGLLAAVFSVQNFASSKVARAVETAILVGLVLLIPLNIRAGLTWRDWYRHGVAEVGRAIEEGQSPEEIAQKHGAFLKHWDRDGLAREIRMLHDASIGPFADSKPSRSPVGKADE